MEANPDFSTISTPDLEVSITRLCADINAATYQQLIMIAEFDRRQGWGYDGVRSCAHWLNWRCGITMSAAREKVRTGHALGNLPQTREAFAAGLLSYSKARAITRVGTEHNEEILLSFARYGTASQLDKTVRLYRQQYEGGELKSDKQKFDEENQRALKQQTDRQLSVDWDHNGCLNIRARLTPEQGAVIIKAIEAAVESVKQNEPSEDAPCRTSSHSEGTSAEVPVGPANYLQQERRRTDALVLMAEAYLKNTKVASRTDDRFQVVLHVDNAFSKPSGEPDCYIEKQVALPVETARRLSCSCKVVAALTSEGEPLNIGRSSRAIPTGIRRALAIRDGVCQFPGCDCQKGLDAHHIVHWANGGDTSLENLNYIITTRLPPTSCQTLRSNPGPGAVTPWITLLRCSVLLMRTGMLVLQTSHLTSCRL